MRWLVLFVLLVLLGVLAEAKLRRLLSSGGRPPAAPSTRREVRQAELVPCARCGLHVDRRRTVERRVGDAPVRFCSAECAERAAPGR